MPYCSSSDNDLAGRGGPLMRHALVAFSAAAAMFVPAASMASPAYDDLQALAKDMTFTWARLHPIVATQEGIAGFDGTLEQPSEVNRTTDMALIASWQGRLDKIVSTNKSSMSLVERDDAALLRAQLTS